MRLTTYLMIWSLVLAASHAGAEPTPYRAVYKASYNGVPISATGIRELRRTVDGQFVLSSIAKSILASVTETTTFDLGGSETIRPLQYEYERTGIGRNRADILRFDWEAQKVVRIADQDGWERDLEPGMHDRLSYQQEMREDLLAAQRSGSDWPEMVYTVAEDDGRIREYRFRVVSEESIEVPAGQFNTIKAERVREHAERITHFWLAPEYDFLLVRFEQTEQDGGGFKLLLRSADFGGEPLGYVKN